MSSFERNSPRSKINDSVVGNFLDRFGEKPASRTRCNVSLIVVSKSRGRSPCRCQPQTLRQPVGRHAYALFRLRRLVRSSSKRHHQRLPVDGGLKRFLKEFPKMAFARTVKVQKRQTQSGMAVGGIGKIADAARCLYGGQPVSPRYLEL